MVHIIAVGHSGSTLLDLLLGAHPQMRGLGETLAVARDPEKYRGRAEQSFLWSEIYAEMDRTGARDEQSRYRIILGVASRYWGEDVILVDSSKEPGWIAVAKEVADVDICAVLLVRDYRSWVVSRRRKLQKTDGGALTMLRGRGLGAWRPLLDRRPVNLARSWARRNTYKRSRLDAMRVPYVVVGYEPLSFDPQGTLQLVCDFLGLTYDTKMVSPANSRSEIIAGNRMAHDPKKLSGIRYDSDWLQRRDWTMLPTLMRRVERMNVDLVYASTSSPDEDGNRRAPAAWTETHQGR